jgi:hypothetical protein
MYHFECNLEFVSKSPKLSTSGVDEIKMALELLSGAKERVLFYEKSNCACYNMEKVKILAP